MNKVKYKKLIKPLKKFFKKENNNFYSKKESKPEKETRKILESIGLPFIQEFNIKYKKYNKFYDFFVFSNDKKIQFIIECHSYWHNQNNLPEYQQLLEIKLNKKIKKKKVTKTIRKNLRNDRLKAAILKELNIPLIIVWEYELEHFPERVIKRIKNEWKRQELLNI